MLIAATLVAVGVMVMGDLALAGTMLTTTPLMGAAEVNYMDMGTGARATLTAAGRQISTSSPRGRRSATRSP